VSWLLWREYRLNRWILVIGAAGILVPHLIFFLAVGNNDDTVLAFGKFMGAYGASSMFGYLAIAMLAGHAIAGERADRSAEFIAYLPLPRWRILASKLVLPLIIIAVIMGMNLVSVNLLALPVDFPLAHMADLRVLPSALLATYGVSWLFSSLLSSPVIASIIGLCTPFVVAGFGMATLNFLGLDVTTPENVLALNGWCAIGCLPLAIVCFSIGTRNYFRRSEP
jgi:ABC-type transport system involved in multi-copper enzyme maturation permease subunit